MSGLEVVGGIASVAQIVSQISQVLRLIRDIHSNMQLGPGSTQDHEKSIQVLQELVLNIQRNHPENDIVKELNARFLEDVELLQSKLRGLSINDTDGPFVRLRKSLKRKSRDYEISKLETRLQSRISMIRICEGSDSYAILTEIHNIMVKKEMMEPKMYPLHEAAPVRESDIRYAFFSSVLAKREPFIGREKTLESLCLELGPGKRQEYAPVALYGPPGIGKTRIAHEYAQQFNTRATNASVFLINGETRASFESDYLKVRLPTNTIRYPTMDDIHRILSDEKSGEWLAIVDNINDENVLLGSNTIPQLIPANINGRAIFITRNKSIAIGLVGAENVKRICALNLVEAKKLLLSRMAVSKFSEGDANITALLAGLDYNPGLICHAGSFITSNSISITEYLRVYLNDKMSMMQHLSQGLDPDPCRGSSATQDRASSSWLSQFEDSFEKIHKESKDAANLLRFMTCVSNHRIPRSLLNAESLPCRQLDQSRALHILKAHCFIDEDDEDEVFNIPNVVCLATYKSLKEYRGLEFWVEAAFGSVYEKFPDLHLDDTAMTTCDRFFIHAEAVLGHEQIPLDKLEARATLATRCSTYLQRKGNYNHAEYFAKKATEWCSRCREGDDEKTLGYMENWATTLRRQGQFDKAGEISQRVWDQRCRINGRYHLATIATMEDLASSLYGQGKFRAAVKMHREAFRNREAQLGATDRDTLMSMSNLCRSLASLGKYRDAEQIGRKAVRLKTETYGAHDPSTLISREHLGTIIRWKGELAEAEEIFKAVYRGRKELHGDIAHPSVLSALGNISGVLVDQGKLEEAEPLARLLWTTNLEVQGANHPDTIKSAVNLSEVLLRLGDLPEAEKLKRQVLQDRRRVLGPSHPDTQYAEACLMGLLEIKDSRDPQGTLVIWDSVENRLEPLNPDNRLSKHVETAGKSNSGPVDEDSVADLSKIAGNLMLSH